jgi:hypothetical protein
MWISLEWTNSPAGDPASIKVSWLGLYDLSFKGAEIHRPWIETDPTAKTRKVF